MDMNWFKLMLLLSVFTYTINIWAENYVWVAISALISFMYVYLLSLQSEPEEEDSKWPHDPEN